MTETIYVDCSICGNGSSYDEESLKASTYIINGIKTILCIPCEDDLLVTLAKGRGIKIKLGEGGEVDQVVFKKTRNTKDRITIEMRREIFDYPNFQNKLLKLIANTEKSIKLESKK